MNKKNFILLLAVLLINILLYFNFQTESKYVISFISISAFIAVFLADKKTKNKTASEFSGYYGKVDDNALKYTLMKLMSEVDKANIDVDVLEQVYTNSLKLFETVITDKKTGLIIENHFKNLLQEETLRSSRYNLKFGLIAIKVLNYDEFKQLNIDYNDILRQIYLSTKSFLREIDQIGRYGNEIIYMLPQTNFKGTVTVADKLLSVIQDIKINDDNTRKINVAIGLSEFPINGKNYETLLNVAEKNVVKSERIGGNQVIFNA